MSMRPASTAKSVERSRPPISHATTPLEKATFFLSQTIQPMKLHAWRLWKNALSKPEATIDSRKPVFNWHNTLFSNSLSPVLNIYNILICQKAPEPLRAIGKS